MALYIWAILIIALLPCAYSIHDYGDLPPGPYCGKVRCCNGRQDECAAPILDTMCYCDEFCDRTTNDDCCPDFRTVCQGAPAPIEMKYCHHHNRPILPGQTVTENCNSCKCGKIGDNVELLCETNKCLIEPEMVNTVNQMSSRYGWQAANYSQFWGRTLSDGIRLRLGTLQPHRFVLQMNPVKRIYDPYSLPKQFDAEEMWPGKIGLVQDQGWCGSSWALSTTAVASDRYAIISKGLEEPTLSAQHLLNCDNRGQQSCNGGYLDRAWQFFRKFGIVDERCLPYQARTEKCHLPRRGNLLTARCTPPTHVDRKEYYRVGPAYRLGNETDIMQEILTSGPVQATIKVYHDFFTYRSGIYQHTDLSENDRTGYHSVRIVGWGEEYSYTGSTKYWKVANSWGTQWGENGYFRILRGSNECDIESFVLGALPEIAQRRI